MEEFFDSLSGAEAKRVAWLLQLIKEVDKIPECYFKKIGGSDGIWEGRIQFGRRSFRVLGFLGRGATLVLTNGFIKKSQKRPRRAIEIAEFCKRDYLERIDEHG